MNEQEVRELISSRVRVTRQDVTLAKSYILSNFNPSPDKMLRRMLEHFQVHKPKEVVVHETVPLEPQILEVAKTLSWQLAFAEAVWGLINSGILIPTRLNIYEIAAQQDWTTVVSGRGGMSSGWNFQEFEISVPSVLRMAPSIEDRVPEAFTDPDLFLQHVGINDLHPEVEEALRQAVKCFKYELFIPCMAMLAKASEGAWIETGLSLLEVNLDDPGLNAQKREQIRKTLTSEYESVVRKMETVSELYKKQDIFQQVAARSGFSHRYLAQVLNWSNVVRDARNAVHYGVDAAAQNTYEKVAALLLGARQNLRILYGIRRAAEELPKS